MYGQRALSDIQEIQENWRRLIALHAGCKLEPSHFSPEVDGGSYALKGCWSY